MIFEVLKEFETETPSGAITLKEGQKVSLSKEEAIPLIEEGTITPVERVAYKVFSDILQAYLWVIDTQQDMHSLRVKGVRDAVYTADEIKELKNLSKEDLKVVHKVREVFLGSAVEETKRKGNRRL